MICKKCGNYIDDNAKFCSHCGSKKGGSKVLSGCFTVIIVLIVIGVIANKSINNQLDNSNNVSTTITTETSNGIETTIINETKELLCSSNNVDIYFCGAEEGTFGQGIEVKFYIENNSNINYTVAVGDCNINDYTITPLLYCEVNANKKANDTLYIYQTMLDDNNITTIENFEISFSAIGFDENNTTSTWNTDLVTIDLSKFLN